MQSPHQGPEDHPDFQAKIREAMTPPRRRLYRLFIPGAVMDRLLAEEVRGIYQQYTSASMLVVAGICAVLSILSPSFAIAACILCLAFGGASFIWARDRRRRMEAVKVSADPPMR